MTRSMRRSLFSVAAFGASAVIAAAQAPVEPLLPLTQGQVVQAPAPKAADPKVVTPKAPPAKAADPSQLPTLPDVPLLTQPAGIAPPSAPLAAASVAIAATALPPVYGDNLLAQTQNPTASGFPATYSPYLRAETPTGMISQVSPGQTALFPVGTVFDRPVTTQIVPVQVGVQQVFDPRTQRFIDVPIYEDRVKVTGTAATANIGGIPVNVVRGALKISENESPRPIDRFYVSYNYFSDVNPTLSVPGLANTNVQRQTIGLEKTFLGGDASIGIRQPLLQVYGPQNAHAECLGDLSVIFKYAFYNESTDIGSVPGGGNLLSGGLVVTAPTGNTGAYSSDQPIIHSTVIQPFLGAIYVRDKVFAQGFSSIAVPTDDRDTTYLFNSLQLGYLLYRAPDASRLLTSVTPIVEVHVNTPLNNRGLYRSPIGAIDVVNFTGGVTLGLGSRSYLNLGTNTPTSGPQPYVIEAIAQLNIRY